jgi:hypothetical protein
MTWTRATAGLVALAAGAVVLFVGVGVGGGGQSGHHRPAFGPFAWLHPGPPPAGWNLARTARGGTLAYPPGWKPIKTDPGTASVALLGDRDRIDGFLNATPKQGKETLANWSRFRPAHNREEGDRSVRLVASARNLKFRDGRGSCVIDVYTTSKATYREIACLVTGRRSPAVIVAAAPVELWNRQATTLQRAVSSFGT